MQMQVDPYELSTNSDTVAHGGLPPSTGSQAAAVSCGTREEREAPLRYGITSTRAIRMDPGRQFVPVGLEGIVRSDRDNIEP